MNGPNERAVVLERSRKCSFGWAIQIMTKWAVHRCWFGADQVIWPNKRFSIVRISGPEQLISSGPVVVRKSDTIRTSFWLTISSNFDTKLSRICLYTIAHNPWDFQQISTVESVWIWKRRCRSKKKWQNPANFCREPPPELWYQL